MSKIKFGFDDFGWVIMCIGMGIGAGIVFLPVQAGMVGLWVLLGASIVAYPSMYLFQRLFVNTLSEADECEDYPGIIAEYLGQNWAALLGFLYLAMLIIWYIIYALAVVNDSASYLHTFKLTTHRWSDYMIYTVVVLAFLCFIASKSERLLFKIASFMAITVMIILTLLGILMIPQWDIESLKHVPHFGEGVKQGVVTLPYVLTSILFLQSLSPMLIFFRKVSKTPEEGRKRSIRAMNIAFIVLFSVVFFYAVSFTLALPHHQAVAAYEQNVSSLAIVAQYHSGSLIKYLGVLLDIFAVLTSFFSIYLALKEAIRGLVMNLLVRYEISEINNRTMNFSIAVGLILLAVIVKIFHIPILSFTLICSPIFGIVGCLIPALLVLKVPKLKKYRNAQLILIIFAGILLCLSPFLAWLI
ncbi:MAG: hypothetical protein GY750_05980 [Lentisphaerae bacterium]|nr:hypothetical protein [Lentisphaerota bacterium]MCP4100958.1 hypothetical protein [Lentisphaerota bacterium]